MGENLYLADLNAPERRFVCPAENLAQAILARLVLHLGHRKPGDQAVDGALPGQDQGRLGEGLVDRGGAVVGVQGTCPTLQPRGSDPGGPTLAGNLDLDRCQRIGASPVGQLVPETFHRTRTGRAYQDARRPAVLAYGDLQVRIPNIQSYDDTHKDPIRNLASTRGRQSVDFQSAAPIRRAMTDR